MIKRKKALKIILILVAFVIVIRLLLPYGVLHYVNKQLAELSGYHGHVADINVSLYRGAYVVEDLWIDRVDTATQKQTELFKAPKIDISIDWRALLRGRIVSEMEFESPVLQFTDDATEPEQMEHDTLDFKKMLKAFTPISVNRIEVFNGKIKYVDPNAKPVVDIEMTGAHLIARNLSNVEDTAALPAQVLATADVYGGKVKFNMRVNALADDPTFDLNVELKDAQLVQLNDFFQAYADFDVNKGTFGMYMELAGKDRKFIGYVKPFIKDLDVVGREDRKDNILRKIWEGIVGVAGDILEAPKSDFIATKVPLAGNYDDRTIGIWYAVFAGLRNGLFKALVPSLDDQVDLQLVSELNKDGVYKGRFFKKIFGGHGGKKQKEPQEKKD